MPVNVNSTALSHRSNASGWDDPAASADQARVAWVTASPGRRAAAPDGDRMTAGVSADRARILAELTARPG